MFAPCFSPVGCPALMLLLLFTPRLVLVLFITLFYACHTAPAEHADARYAHAMPPPYLLCAAAASHFTRHYCQPRLHASYFSAHAAYVTTFTMSLGATTPTPLYCRLPLPHGLHAGFAIYAQPFCRPALMMSPTLSAIRAVNYCLCLPVAEPPGTTGASESKSRDAS